jgi:FixJ family two-component response regulator
MNAAAGFVHVIDDDASWRKSVERLMSAAGYNVALYESAEAFLQKQEFEGPGCILLDVRMPGLSGLQLQQRLVAMRRALPIVFLSGHGDIPLTVLAMKAGAEDFLSKPVDTDVLLAVVAQAVARDRQGRGEREQLAELHSHVESLTPTERKVFDRVVRGKLNKQIAAELGMVERTVKWHRHNIAQKLDLESLAAWVSLAERLALIAAAGRTGSTSE